VLVLMTGCAAEPTALLPLGASLAKGGKPGSGGGATATASFSGAMNSADQAVAVGSSSGGLTFSASSYQLDLDLGSAWSTNQAACSTEPTNLPGYALDTLVARLGASTNGAMEVAIDAQAAVNGTSSVENTISLRNDIWLQLGKNNDRIGAGWPTVTYSGPGDFADATQPRVFTFQNTTGDLRVVWRYDGNGDGKVKANDPVGHLTCPLANLTSPIVLTVNPSP
jgi:hypothetical protein